MFRMFFKLISSKKFNIVWGKLFKSCLFIEKALLGSSYSSGTHREDLATLKLMMLLLLRPSEGWDYRHVLLHSLI